VVGSWRSQGDIDDPYHQGFSGSNWKLWGWKVWIGEIGDVNDALAMFDAAKPGRWARAHNIRSRGMVPTLLGLTRFP
jgi:hypothetical protein